MRRSVLVCLLSSAAAVPAHGQQRSSFPIEPGLTWTYRGQVRWTGTDGRTHAASITHTMTIVSVETGPNARAALVRGWVQDLARYEQSNKRAFSALVGRGGRLYHVVARDSADAVALATTAVRDDAPPPELETLVLDSALVVGAVYGRDSVTSKRDDNMYGWHVASDRVVGARAAWQPTGARVRHVTLEYRTQPDYQRIEYVPGVGITRFVYSHHGTVAEADVQLVSLQR